MPTFDIYASRDSTKGKLLTINAANADEAARKACDGRLGTAYIDTRTVVAVPEGKDPPLNTDPLWRMLVGD